MFQYKLRTIWVHNIPNMRANANNNGLPKCVSLMTYLRGFKNVK